MNDKQMTNNDKDLIIEYLYQDLTDSQRLEFEQRLKQDAEFRQLFEQQQLLDQVMNSGTQPQITQQRLDAVHWSLQKKLRSQANKQNTIFTRLVNLWRSNVSFKAQFASMIMTFGLGFVFAYSTVTKTPTQEEALSLIQNDDYQITDLQLSQLDTNSDQVKISYSTSSKTQLEGQLSSQHIQNLLAATIKNNVSDSTRLDLVEVLKNYLDSNQVRDALSYSLLNDPNPGVRLAAAKSLANLSANKDIRQVLRQALQNDINAGIRVEVFDALNKHLDDPETLELFEKFSTKDANAYIRQRAKKLSENTQI